MIAIHRAATSEDFATARALFVEYQRAIGVDLCFQNFAQELAGLPGDYVAPRGCLLIADQNGSARGCVALRPLPGGGESSRHTGEVKRLYVDPAARGAGVGRALMLALLDRARGAGYRELKLDTLASMASARSLYGSLGFRPCAAYYDNPLPGVAYMSLVLDGG